jgi:hypothetical protein
LSCADSPPVLLMRTKDKTHQYFVDSRHPRSTQLLLPFETAMQPGKTRAHHVVHFELVIVLCRLLACMPVRHRSWTVQVRKDGRSAISQAQSCYARHSLTVATFVACEKLLKDHPDGKLSSTHKLHFVDATDQRACAGLCHIE